MVFCQQATPLAFLDETANADRLFGMGFFHLGQVYKETTMGFADILMLPQLS
jgi:hypothetical protein